MNKKIPINEIINLEEDKAKLKITISSNSFMNKNSSIWLITLINGIIKIKNMNIDTKIINGSAETTENPNSKIYIPNII